MPKERESETGLPERWSAKAEVVLRLLRGEAVDAVSREIQVSAHELETWRRDFLEGGVAGWKPGALDPEERELKQTPATAVSDGELVRAIRAVLAASWFHGEGDRKCVRGAVVGGSAWGRPGSCG